MKTDSKQNGHIAVGEQPAPMRLLLKPEEAAEALAISPRTLWALTNSGEIPKLKIGRCVRYDVDDLRAWVAAQKDRAGR